MRDETAVRVFVLDYLRHGPCKLDDLLLAAWSQFAFTREEIMRAFLSLGIPGEKRDGVIYAMKPDNLHAIWWAKRAPAHRFTGAARGGSAA